MVCFMYQNDAPRSSLQFSLNNHFPNSFPKAAILILLVKKNRSQKTWHGTLINQTDAWQSIAQSILDQRARGRMFAGRRVTVRKQTTCAHCIVEKSSFQNCFITGSILSRVLLANRLKQKLRDGYLRERRC